jgi:hypothetical protein
LRRKDGLLRPDLHTNVARVCVCVCARARVCVCSRVQDHLDSYLALHQPEREADIMVCEAGLE